jgi:hypothetical protein
VENVVLAVEQNAFLNPRLYVLSLRERIKVRVGGLLRTTPLTAHHHRT